MIILAVRWYLRTDSRIGMSRSCSTERGVAADHVSVYRWVQRFTPLLVDAARPLRHVTEGRWFDDETYSPLFAS